MHTLAVQVDLAHPENHMVCRQVPGGYRVPGGV